MCQGAVELATFNFEIAARQLNPLQRRKHFNARKEHGAGKIIRFVDALRLNTATLGQGDKQRAVAFAEESGDWHQVSLRTQHRHMHRVGQVFQRSTESYRVQQIIE
ncbi:hypothetical protein D3C81_1358430 [compost metagenome]